MAKETRRVDKMTLINELMQIKTACPATFVAITEVKMNKTDNPYVGRVTKKQKSNVFINFNYANSVNKALLKEGKEANFVPKPRVWGEKIPGTPIIHHIKEDKKTHVKEENYYLEARFLNNEPQIEYFLDGKPADKTEFETFLPVRKNKTKLITEEIEIEGHTETIEIEVDDNQGLEQVVAIRDFKIDSIHEITVNGIHWVRNDV